MSSAAHSPGQPLDFTESKEERQSSPPASSRRRGSSHSSQQQQRVGTLIPNRIFVGGIPSGATVLELKEFFTAFGEVRDVKIITDKSGVSKGYGFVTFESAGVAEEIIRRDEHEDLVFKDRKLNLGPAIKKQPLFPRPELTNNAVFFTSGAVPYTYQNGMAVFHLPTAGLYSPQVSTPELSYSSYIAAAQPQGPLMYIPAAGAAANHSGSPATANQQQQQQLQQQHGVQSNTPSNNTPDASMGPFGIHQSQLMSPMAPMPCYGTPTRTPVGGTLAPMIPYEGYQSCTSDYGTDASYTDQSAIGEASMEMDPSLYHLAVSSPQCFQTSPMLCNPQMQAVRAYHPMMMSSSGQMAASIAASPPPPIARIVSQSGSRALSADAEAKMNATHLPSQSS